MSNVSLPIEKNLFIHPSLKHLMCSDYVSDTAKPYSCQKMILSLTFGVNDVMGGQTSRKDYDATKYIQCKRAKTMIIFNIY